MTEKFRKAVNECEESKQNYSKRSLQWCGERVKEVVTSSAEERKPGEERAQQGQHWEGLVGKQEKRNKQNHGKWKTELI